ncbi:hypothetical protein WSK_3796 [Novosphingobium sp. Rr 2-17]|uniref:hypothetical protein n=1 Tax=Novosphingobium sp. Rr 2-17 TaxID=555793 RepID=UPI00026988EC|nr:hypothetical protein [Novosphingobium sp. Rr 2-17]EIZ77785.1 hypothetical protein WSK_3796 [Novosphingobium sp. Rr 2-17]
MVADTAEEYFDLVLDPSSNIVKTKAELSAALDDFDAPSGVKSTFVETARIGPKGGVVHFEYHDLWQVLGEDNFFLFLERLGMSRKMFAIFENTNCSPHPIGQYGRCEGKSWTSCISGPNGCA